MTKVIKRVKKVSKSVASKKGEFEKIKPSQVEEIVPHCRYIVKLDCEDTKFLVTFRNDTIVQCMALDGTYETITIPLSQFNRGKYTFDYEDSGKTKKHIATVEVFRG